MLKRILISIIILILLLLPIDTMAATDDSVLIITLKDATIRAVDANNNITSIGKSIKKQRKRYGGSYVADIQNRDRYSLVTRMNELYDKLVRNKLMSLDEQGELMLLFDVFKNTDYTTKMKLEPLINSEDFPDALDCAAIVKTCINKELLTVSVEDSVRQLYDSILQVENSVEVSNKLYNLQEIKYEATKKNFLNGYVSEEARFIAEQDLKKQGLEVNKVQRQLKNLQLSFKKLTNIDLNKEIKLVPYKTDISYTIGTYNSYLNQALLHRNEIVSSKVDLKAAKIQLYRFNLLYRFEFSNSELDLYKRDMELQIDSLNQQIDENRLAVEQDIKIAYIDLLNQKELLAASKVTFDLQAKNYKEAKIKLDAGTLSKLQYKAAELSYSQAKNDYEAAQRRFDYSINKMKNCCNLGPKYQ